MRYTCEDTEILFPLAHIRYTDTATDTDTAGKCKCGQLSPVEKDEAKV